MSISNPKAIHKKTSPVMHDPKHTFDLMVINAVDFFDNSIKDFEKNPKHSVINFHSGLELLLKSRLLLEHWSLILKDPEKADINKFQSGDFISVSIPEIIDRLKKICKETFSAEETKCFERLRDHRNKMVHFFHHAHSRKPDKKLLEGIAAEQCRAWCHLHRRLTGEWDTYFTKHCRAIDRINNSLHARRIFLKTKYLTLRPEIGREIADGINYRKCFACEFLSGRVSERHEPVNEAECRVCGSRSTFLRIACPSCGKVSDIKDLGFAPCKDEACGHDITLSEVMKKYVPPHDPKDEKDAYYCAKCEQSEPSATVLGDQYFCFWCQQWFDTADQCGFCGSELVGFDSDGSGYVGCFMCREAASEHFDKD